MSQGNNSFERTLADGEAAFGVLDNTYTPAAVELIGELGFDFAWIDLEHAGPSPLDGDALDGLCRAAELVYTELLVRVPPDDPSAVRKCLDAGVTNVFVSRVETAEQAREAVAAGRFRYDGRPGTRGLGTPRAARYGRDADYVDTADEDVVVGVTVETERGVDNVASILDVPELGFVFVGPNDLSVSLGHPGELDHPDVVGAVETVRSRALDANVPVGNLTFGVEDAAEKVEAGYQVLHAGSTLGALAGQFGDWRERVTDTR